MKSHICIMYVSYFQNIFTVIILNHMPFYRMKVEKVAGMKQ